jgi:hypothetical protein
MSQTVMLAFCIECGRETSRDPQSYVLCSQTCFSLEKAARITTVPHCFCNICGSRMMPGSTDLSHKHCNIGWQLRQAGRIQ